MKKMLLGLVFISAAAFCALWFTAANTLKKDVEKSIVQANSLPNVSIHYDQLSATGFPLRVGVKVTGLRANVATGKFVAMLPKSMIDQFSAKLNNEDFKAITTLQNEVIFTQSVTVSTNLLGTDWHIRSGNYDEISFDRSGRFASSNTGESMYGVSFKHSMLMDMVRKKPVFSDPKVLLANLESIYVINEKTTVTDRESKNVIYKTDGFKFTLERKPTDKKAIDDYRLVFKSAGKMSPDYLTGVMRLDSMKALLKLTDVIMIYQNGGEADFDIDISARAPSYASLQTILPNPDALKILSSGILQNKFALSVNRWHVITPLYSSEAKGKTVVDNQQAPLGNVSLDFSGQYAFDQRYGDMIRAQLFSQYAAVIQKKGHQAQSIKSSINSAISDFQTFGKMKFDIAMRAKDGGTQVDVDHLKFSCDQFGIKAAGQYNAKNHTIDADIKLNQFESLIDHLVPMGRALMTIGQLEEEKNGMSNPEEIIIQTDAKAKLKTFLRDISNAPKSVERDLNITVKTQSDHSIVVGTLPLDQVVVKAQALSSSIQSSGAETQSVSAH